MEQPQQQMEQPQQQMEQPQQQMEQPQQQMEQASNRLGQCQRCNTWAARYTCPGCLEHTCSLTCSTAHKVATGCSGKRDPTEFVPLKSFTDANLLSDYRFLESVDHSLDRVMRLRQSLCTPVGGGGSGARGPSKQQRELQAFCRASRGIELVFMPAGMSRRRCNRSHLRQAGRRNSQSGSAPAVHWTVEARFPTGRKFASAPDTSRLSEILQRWRHLWPSQQPDCSLCRLDQGDKLCPIDCNQSLADLLRGTTVVEFPVFVIR
ncbi:hypothetical protein BOX15_Mlig027711g1 [Macrostomum lignano]|uniref:HIT-type domain-containing protein n=1 Tax=Macrostomum lignano TaxID=282301 RepID=A0A267ERT9_9PLAT|nr:hypothetical protein BOX15_Mlig027711g1 [Macrostomum lignano]